MSTFPLWWDEDPRPGPAEPAASSLAALGPGRADVLVVGGGYTGLWTAYHLLRHAPDLRVVVLEARYVGFGASGRNGGWVSALWPVAPETIAARHGREATVRFLGTLRETVDAVGDFCAREAPEVGFVRGGALMVARGPAQRIRAEAYAATSAQWGTGVTWLTAGETRERIGVPDALGATFDPHCARVQPRRLVLALARAVRALGGVIVEGAEVTSIEPGRVRLASGAALSADAVIRATEAWTARLPGARRRVAPVYSLMVATEPLSEATWAQVGLAGREVFADHGHLVIYGQRTVDDRIAFGGRGAPYHWGSRVRPEYDRAERVFAGLRRTLTGLLPALEGVRFTHAWGGPLGIARDWHPAVVFDPATGLGAAGGYVGDGVAASALAGRTLADLVLRRSSEVTSLPWVGHRGRAWEPEPLRWLGINAGLRLAAVADAEERVTARPARTAYVLDKLTGG